MRKPKFNVSLFLGMDHDIRAWIKAAWETFLGA